MAASSLNLSSGSYTNQEGNTIVDSVRWTYLKEESRTKSEKQITKNDFIVEKLPQFIILFNSYISSNIKNWAISNFNRALKLERPDFFSMVESPYVDLKENKKKQFDEQLQDRATEDAKSVLKMFHEGRTFHECLNYRSRSEAFPVTERDFKCYNPNKPAEESLKQELQKVRFSKTLEKRRIEKENEKKFDLSQSLEKLDDVNAIYFRIKWFTSISAFSKPLNDQNLVTVEPDSALLSRFKKEINDCIDKIAQKHADELLLEAGATQKSSPKTELTKKKKNKKKGGAATRQDQNNQNSQSISTAEDQVANRGVSVANDPLAQIVFNLNNSSLNVSYSVHRRILRWKVHHLDSIKEFLDFDHARGEYVKNYARASKEELLTAKHHHNLAGIERVLANEELCAKYTFPFEYRDPRSGKVQEGRGFYSVKMKEQGQKQPGIIYVGMSKDLIYHAAFVPVSRNFFPRDLQANLRYVEMKEDEAHDESSEAGWENVSDCVFNLLVDGVISMEIGKNPEERITYLLYPLN